MMNPLSISQRRLTEPAKHSKDSTNMRGQKSPQNIQYRQPLQKFVNFEAKKYPFQNTTNQHGYIFRTIFYKGGSQAHTVQHLANYTHPNLIGVENIQRNLGRGEPRKLGRGEPAKQLVGYSVMHQIVPYSIKYIGLGHETNKTIFKMIASAGFKEVLISLYIYLKSKGVEHMVKLSDIGVDEKGQIQIYVSPDIITASNPPKHDQKSIQKNIEKLVSWWETTFLSSEPSQCSSSTNTLNRNRFIDQGCKQDRCKQDRCKHDSCKHDGCKQDGCKHDRCKHDSCKHDGCKHDDHSNDSFTGSDAIKEHLFTKQGKDHESFHRKAFSKGPLLTTNLKSSSKSFKSQISKINKLQEQNIRKLDQEVKAIKEKIKSKNKTRNMIKQSDNIMHKIHQMKAQKVRQKTNFFESERFERKNPEDSSGVDVQARKEKESIQQNINCINIYNHPPKNYERSSQLIQSVKRLSYQPVLSYMITPPSELQKVVSSQPNILGSQPNVLGSQPNVIPAGKKSVFEEAFEQIEDQPSFDTYEIEANIREDPEFFEKASYRQTLTSLDRQVSERNHKIRKLKIQKQVAKPLLSSNQLDSNNQVENRNFTTESAGPLQFKKFVNKYIKPEFLSKKSNIYEDPLEYDSQHSTEHHRGLRIDLGNRCRSINSGTFASKSSKKFNEYSPDVVKPHERAAKQIIPRIYSDNQIPKFKKYVHQKAKPEQQSFYEQHSCEVVKKRVQDILERTKNAISIMNKVKKGRSPEMTTRIIASNIYQ